MGSANGQNSTNEKLVKVSTSDLREKLNSLYKGRRFASAARQDGGCFDYLWDLKELALMDGRQSVEVPEAWLNIIEKESQGCDLRQGH